MYPGDVKAKRIHAASQLCSWGALGKGVEKWQTDPFKDLPPAEKEQEISIQISFLAHLSYVGCSLVLIAHMMFTMYFTLTQSQP